jgi:hypothetical protein
MLRLKHLEATFAAAVVGFLGSYAGAEEFTAHLDFRAADDSGAPV